MNKATGSGGVNSSFDLYIKALKKKVHKVVIEEGSRIKMLSMEETPVDTGLLRASHYAIVDRHMLGFTAYIGANTDYALYVHENLQSYHSVGGANFLTRALFADTKSIGSKLKRAML